MTPSAFSRLFRRPAGTASVEYGFFAAVIAVGVLTILGSIGGPMRVQIAPDTPPATLAAAPETPQTATAEKPASTTESAIAVTDTSMVRIEQALAALEAEDARRADPDTVARDEAFEKLIQTLLIEETENAESPAALSPADDAAAQTAAIVDRTTTPEAPDAPAGDWIPATGFLPDSGLKPMPRPDRLAAN